MVFSSGSILTYILLFVLLLPCLLECRRLLLLQQGKRLKMGHMTCSFCYILSIVFRLGVVVIVALVPSQSDAHSNHFGSISQEDHSLLLSL